jgi:hypothetical protein
MKLRALMLLCIILTIAGLCGCKDQSEASVILPQVCKEFPDSVIYKFDPRVLWIQTHVDGISPELAEMLYEGACQKAAKSFGQIKFNWINELQFDGRSILVIGFKRIVIACDLRDGTDAYGRLKAKIMNFQQVPSWLTQHIGYAPSDDKVMIVTLADAQNTPKGEPMNLHTLTEFKAAYKAKQQEQLNDYILKQKAEQDAK